MFRTFARASQEASGVNGVRRSRKNHRARFLPTVVRGCRTFTYHADGQLASASCDGIGRAGAHASSDIASQCSLRSGDMHTPQTETFLWDGLALIQRGDEQFINEPHVGGGNPVTSSKGTSYFNDMLGTTVGSKSNGKYSAAALTAFGEDLTVHSPTPTQNSNFFTGKPFVEGLGHAFLMRNYRAGLAKWQTIDPMGYPDGWNALAYCNNGVVSSVDVYGAERYDHAWRVIVSHWLGGSGDELDIFYDSYFSDYMNANALLNNSIRYWLLTYAYGYSAGLINMRRHAEIENGYYTGYELLHGSNGDVGDFQMWGGFTTERLGNYLLYHFDITCQWNDKIDPNYSYDSDMALETMIRLFGFPFSYFSPADYVIRIRWNKQLTIKVVYE